MSLLPFRSKIFDNLCFQVQFIEFMNELMVDIECRSQIKSVIAKKLWTKFYRSVNWSFWSSYSGGKVLLVSSVLWNSTLHGCVSLVNTNFARNHTIQSFLQMLLWRIGIAISRKECLQCYLGLIKACFSMPSLYKTWMILEYNQYHTDQRC